MFGEQRPAFTGLKDEEVIERIAAKWPLGSAVHLSFRHRGETVRPRKGSSGITWRERLYVTTLEEQGSHSAPPFTRIGTMVMYSVRELEG